MDNPYNRYDKYLISLVLSVFLIVLFWQVQHHYFILYDDCLYVTENYNVQRGLSWESVTWAMTATEAGFWHPLTWLSLMLDYQMFGLNPGGFHWTNALLHIANTILLFFVLSRMTEETWKSALVAALFAFHPLHVESVAWVSQRKDVLSTFFWFLTMLAYVCYAERPRIYRYVPVVFFYVMGLMSKPMLVTLPFVLLLLDYWPLRRFSAYSSHVMGKIRFPQIPPFSLILEKIPLLVLATGLVVVTFYTEEKIGALKSLEMFPVELRTANAIVSYAGYIWKMMWPINLTVFYPYHDVLPWWQVVSSAVILVLITIPVFYNIKRSPFLIVGWLWYLGTLVPVIGLVQIGEHAMADRYTYIPLIGLFIIIVWGASDLPKGWRWRHKKTLLGLSSGIILSALMILTWFQIQYWKDNVTLFRHAVHVTNSSFLAHINLGAALSQKEKWDEAMECFLNALRIKPHNVLIYNNMGLAMAHQGKLDEAVDYYDTALRIKPDDEKVHNNLAMALADQGRLDEAIRHYREALKIKPDYAAAHNNLANVLAGHGEVDEAIRHYREALRLEPEHADFHNNLGVALARRKQLEDAVYHFREALRLKPDHSGARKNMNALLPGHGGN
ncbi:MAG: tetratricopeptide repeat protein [Deltaproteobacteria bacterium]|nr:tetratricopeptide repeat protein [Deltaproteobacteria bacterium]